MSAVDEVSDRYVAEFARLDPCTAALMGIAGQESALTDYSPQGWAARHALTTATLAELARTPPQDDADRIAAQVLTERLQADAALAGAGVPEADLNVMDGPLQRIRLSIEVLDQGAATRWELVLDRLRALPAALAGAQVSLAEAARHGRVAAQRQVLANARQAEQTAASLQRLAARYATSPYATSPYATGCADGDGQARGDADGHLGGTFQPGADSARRGDERLASALRDAGDAAARALGDFGAFLTGELLPRAPHRDALGRERYEIEVRNHLGTTLDLENTYAWGWEELARLDARMRALAAEILPGRPLEEVFAALDADPAHQVTGADAFRDHLQQLADTTIGRLHGVHFDIPGPLRRIECRIPPTAAGGVYYLAPAEDLSRPGQVWWTLPDSPSGTVPVWTAPATMYHEGVPGHHLQLGATVLSTSLNRFRRMSAELHPGHAEGWALYAERLMGELGFYSDPAHELGMLAGGQQLRAARVVLDIGLHLQLPIPKGSGFHEGERWNRDLGLAFLRRRLPEDESSLVFEIDRYLGKPAQAIAYKVGERVWLQAREAARRAQGPAFRLKAFHQAALDLGPMGLDLLHTELARLSAPVP